MSAAKRKKHEVVLADLMPALIKSPTDIVVGVHRLSPNEIYYIYDIGPERGYLLYYYEDGNLIQGPQFSERGYDNIFIGLKELRDQRIDEILNCDN